MSDTTVRTEWIGRVLGVDISPSAQRAREAKAANARGIAYPKMLLIWRTAQTAAATALDDMGKRYLALPNVQADDRYARVKAAVTTLPTLIPRFGGELEDLLDRGINVGNDRDIAPAALKVIADYRNALTQAPTMSALEAFAKRHAGGLTVLGLLDRALAGIASNLQTAIK